MFLHGLNVVFLQVSSVEVVQAYIDRIQEVNPFLNAVVKDRREPNSVSISVFTLMPNLHVFFCCFFLKI